MFRKPIAATRSGRWHRCSSSCATPSRSASTAIARGGAAGPPGRRTGAATRSATYHCRNPGRAMETLAARARAAGKRRPHRRGRPDRAGIRQAQGRLQHGGRRASRRHRRHFQSTEIVHGSAADISEAANNLRVGPNSRAAALEETAAASRRDHLHRTPGIDVPRSARHGRRDEGERGEIRWYRAQCDRCDGADRSLVSR